MTADVKPALSVLLPAYNAADTIAVQLDALARQTATEPWELVFADNGSTDETASIVQSFSDRIATIRIVDASARRGAAYALNCAAEASESDLLVMCDADDEVADGWMHGMWEGLRRHDFVMSAIDTRRLNPAWLQECRENGFEFGTVNLPFEPYAPYGQTAGLGIRRELHNAVGGFDGAMAPLHDVDYCVRLFQLGVELVFLPDAIVNYRYRQDSSEIYRQAYSYARALVALQSRYARREGAPLTATWPLKGWNPLLRSLPRVRTREGQARLAWAAGWQMGRSAGSLKHRIRAV